MFFNFITDEPSVCLAWELEHSPAHAGHVQARQGLPRLPASSGAHSSRACDTRALRVPYC